MLAATDNNQVLYLSYDGLTDPLGQSQILPYLCGLSHEYSITIISFEKEERYTNGRGLIEDLCNQHHINWVPLKYHKKPAILSTIYDLFTLLKTVKLLHKKNSYNIIHCRSYITSLIGLKMKRKYGVKFIFDMRGFWADERVEGGLWKLDNPLYKFVYDFFKRKEIQFLIESDYVISLTHNAKNIIVSWGIKTNIKVIPCCVDLKHFDPEKITRAEKENLRSELGILRDDFVLLYLGSLGTWYLVKEMFNFFNELKKIKANAKFLLLTPDKVELNEYDADSLIIRSVSRNDVPLFMSIAQASIMFIKPSFSKKGSSATKMAEVMAMNIPIIVNNGWGDVNDTPEVGNQIVKIDIQQDFCRHIVKVLAFETSTLNRIYARDNFSLQFGVNSYRNIYSYLLNA